MEWKSIKIDKAYGEYQYLLEILVNENDEVIFSQLSEIPPIKGDFKHFVLGYGIMNLALDLPDEIKMDEIPHDSFISYSYFFDKPKTENCPDILYYNEQVIAYDEKGKIISKQEFLSDESIQHIEIGKIQKYNMNSLMSLVGKNFSDIQLMAQDLFYNDDILIREETSRSFN